MNPKSKKLVLILLSMSVWLSANLNAGEFAFPPKAEAYLHSGQFRNGEADLNAYLVDNPRDDGARFGLGVIQFMLAIENFGQALHKYGARSDKVGIPIFRLPVPLNENPEAVSFEELGKVLERLYGDLCKAEATLAWINAEDVQLELRLAAIRFDLTGTGEHPITLTDFMRSLNQTRFPFEEKNPEFLVRFDRGDVAWLRAYCHLLCAMIDGYQAVDLRSTISSSLRLVFPKLESVELTQEERAEEWVHLIAPFRLQDMRLHLIEVCKLNRETWEFIRAEVDDDFEWLPHPRQTDMLELPIDDRSIDAWLRMMDHFEGLLEGKRLIPSRIIQSIFRNHEEGMGLNIKALLDGPPRDLFNFDRIAKQGIEKRYLEPEKGRLLFEMDVIFGVFRLFGDPLGYARAIRMN